MIKKNNSAREFTVIETISLQWYGTELILIFIPNELSCPERHLQSNVLF